MSRTYNSKQRGVRKLRNKLYEFNLRLSFDELLHAKKKDKTKNRILRKKLKEQAKKRSRFQYLKKHLFKGVLRVLTNCSITISKQ